MKYFALATIILSGLACQPQDGNEASQQAKPVAISQVILLSDNAGKPDSPVKEFDYRQKTLHFRIQLSAPIEKQPGKWIFSAKQTSAGNGQQLSAIDGVFEGKEMLGKISLPTNWPVGTYHVNVLIANESMGEFDFIVSGETSRIVFLGHTLAPDSGNGLPGKPVESFMTNQRTIHLQVTSKGIDTSEPEVIWRLFLVEKGGKAVEVANTMQPKVKLQDSVLKCQFASNKDWTAGNYRAAVELNGKRVHTFDFKIIPVK